MQVILQGSVRHFPAAELLRFLTRRGQNGTLDLENQGRRTRILFENDAIRWAESSAIPDAVDAVLDALEWTGGTFTLLDSVALPANATPLSLTLEALEEEAQKRAQRYRDDTLFRVVESPAQQKVSLTGDQFKILFRVSGGRTLAELVADLGTEKEKLIEQLQKLEELGLVESGFEAPAASAPAPAPAAQQTAPPPPIPEHPFAPKTDPIPVQEEAEVTRVERATMSRPKTIVRKNTLVGSLTPDQEPDSIFPLLDAEIVIGRAAENAISVSDGSVSSRHAKITRSAEGFVIEDLQSRNGTFVNGEKVDKPRLLADGDLVRLGKYIMTFNVAQIMKAAEQTEPEVRL